MRKAIGSIAGGGIYGIGPIAWLAGLEAALFRLGLGPLSALFALFIGTSVGGILSALLACGYSAKASLDIFRPHVAKIFGTRLWAYRLFKKGPRYDDTYVTNLLKQMFGSRTMSQTETPLYITAWDYRTTDLKVFGPADTLVPIWYAVRCGMSATSYFAPMPGYQIVDGKFTLERTCRYGDGGFGANDPLVLGMGAGIDDGLVDPTDFRLINLVTSGLNPERGPVDPDAFILTELEQQILPAITAGNSSSVYFTAIRWLRTLGQSPNKLLRVRPPCANGDLDSVSLVAGIEKLWADQLEKDVEGAVALLTGKV